MILLLDFVWTDLTMIVIFGNLYMRYDAYYIAYSENQHYFIVAWSVSDLCLLPLLI